VEEFIFSLGFVLIMDVCLSVVGIRLNNFRIHLLPEFWSQKIFLVHWIEDLIV